MLMNRQARRLIQSRQDASGLSMNEIIDRMAEAICAESGGPSWATICREADAGIIAADAMRARYRRMARKAHTAFLTALDSKGARP